MRVDLLDKHRAKLGYAAAMLHALVGSSLIPVSVRGAIYNILGWRIGNSVEIGHHVTLGTGVSLGDGVSVNHFCYLGGRLPVIVESNVKFGTHVKVISSGHDVGPSNLRCGEERKSKITIGRGAWIATGAIILPGVTIGYGAIVCAGAVVHKDVAPNTMVGGNPARFIRRLDAEVVPLRAV